MLHLASGTHKVFEKYRKRYLSRFSHRLWPSKLHCSALTIFGKFACTTIKAFFLLTMPSSRADRAEEEYLEHDPHHDHGAGRDDFGGIMMEEL